MPKSHVGKQAGVEQVKNYPANAEQQHCKQQSYNQSNVYIARDIFRRFQHIRFLNFPKLIFLGMFAQILISVGMIFIE